MHACDQVLHALLIFSHPFWAAFHVLPLGFFSVGAARIWATLLECTSSCFSLCRMESQPDIILLPLFMTECSKHCYSVSNKGRLQKMICSYLTDLAQCTGC